MNFLMTPAGGQAKATRESIRGEREEKCGSNQFPRQFCFVRFFFFFQTCFISKLAGKQKNSKTMSFLDNREASRFPSTFLLSLKSKQLSKCTFPPTLKSLSFASFPRARHVRRCACAVEAVAGRREAQADAEEGGREAQGARPLRLPGELCATSSLERIRRGENKCCAVFFFHGKAHVVWVFFMGKHRLCGFF